MSRVRRPATAVLLLTLAGVAMSWQASAEAASARDHRRDHGVMHGHHTTKVRAGNGQYNRNYVTVSGPTTQRGVQQVSNTIIGGRDHNVNILCKGRHICKIHQHLRIVNGR
ncbi:hypothetical protein [Sphaerisporangium fuscum]|uniref:hypothetical protein n=1 Tax=Sphaerisporangium fuscum TaxID=2835868 RepID=UPI001BDC4FCD|nr:hypothetical protein [Sphaerisporangium fuscum]